jgi:hypothetical protein
MVENPASDDGFPALSVVITTPDRYDTIRKTIRSLRAQTVRGQLEIVIVAPSAAELALDRSDLRAFRRVGVVEVGPIRSVGAANAAGVWHATAPLVALAEDHAFPDSGWAAALIARHREPWAAVGPVLRNANPDTPISWADFLVAYAPWVDSTPAGAVDHLPGHNSSYKRDLLLTYGTHLESMLEAETLLHWDLRSKGCQLYLEPAAKLFHTNFALAPAWMTSQFYGGRLFAATRAAESHWSRSRRVLYTGAAPLIPFVRLWRILPALRRVRRHERLPAGVFPTLILGLLLDGAGQFAGYLLGAGNARQRVSHLEYHRDDHITASDKLQQRRVDDSILQ